MNLEEIRDRVKETFQTQWQKFQETATYAQFKEKYDDLPSTQQTLLKLAASLVGLSILIFPPYSWYQSSANNLASFEENRGLLKQILHVGRQMQETPEIIPQLSTAEVKSRITGVVGTLQLMPDQLKGMVEGPFPARPDSRLIPKQLTPQGVDLTLDRLNLRQVVDLVFRIQSLKDAGIRIFSMDLARAPGETHFYAVRMQVGNLLSAPTGLTAPGGDTKSKNGQAP
jgi:hypothetical protein